jgi:site-specific DNA-methyltransferase (adenine-specific)
MSVRTIEDRATLHLGDCLDVLRTMEDASVDAVVTDPPYGLAFMGKRWDYDVPSEDIWRECLRVLKPGGHLLAFAGTRTQHRMAVRIEDAGFEIRDMIAWVYGSGFPKSLDVSKAIDGRLTTGRSDSIALREVNETRPGDATVRATSTNGHRGIVGSADAGPSVKRDEPATEAARQWSGWGTALKPALEPITVARKPLIGTVAQNVLEHGTGALNVDGCRVEADPADPVHSAIYHAKPSVAYGRFASKENGEARSMAPPPAGRWPANLIHDGSDEVVGLFPITSTGNLSPYQQQTRQGACYGKQPAFRNAQSTGDTGSAARFFYCAKASKADRDQENRHPTVKPTDLMRYLCRLVTPPGGTVLDPFMGSGSTGKAAILEGFRFIGIEREPDYLTIAEARIRAAIPEQHTLPLDTP